MAAARPRRTWVVAPGAATLREVAARAGVSVSTASRILGGRSRPRGQNGVAIADAVEKLGYRADTVARSMRTGSTAAIGVVIDNLLDPVVPTLVRAITDAAGKAGYAIVLGTALRGPAQAALEIESMLERRVDGLIIACSWPSGALGTSAANLLVPVVLVNTDGPGVGLPQFGTDNVTGARLAARHLLDLGHRHMAYVGGPASAPFNALRMTGIRAALAEAGVSPRSLHVVAGDGTTAAGARAAVRILLQAPDVTAIATYNDLTAIGVVRGLYEAGRSVPGDLSVIGFDGIAEAGWMQPPLTTVSQESARMGRLAAEHLIRLLAGSSTGVVEDPVRLPMTLIPRESTARPRSMRGA